VTVLFADVVHSMDIAATVGPERLREIMTELLDRSMAVVRRYGGTVDKFTGDGMMAVFGAPVSLEDHAVRACLAALDIQQEAKRLAVEVRERDGLNLQLRVGLNSGQVIAGEIGSGPFRCATVLPVPLCVRGSPLAWGGADRGVSSAATPPPSGSPRPALIVTFGGLPVARCVAQASS
jgi:class 3 adenylate cyclase